MMITSPIRPPSSVLLVAKAQFNYAQSNETSRRAFGRGTFVTASLLASSHGSAPIIMLTKRVRAHRWRALVCGYMIGVFFTGVD